MDTHVTRLTGNDPGYRPLPSDLHETQALACHAEAEPHLREIEEVSYALSTFWDHGEYDVTEDDVRAAREMGAWLQTMPEHLKQRIIGHIAAERRRSRPSLPLTVLGHKFGGYDP